MTLIGQKRDPNQPRKPMKRSPMRRKKPIGAGRPLEGSVSDEAPETARTPSEWKKLAREAWLELYRGVPCEVCGRTAWNRQLSTAHHILKAENYPEYYFERMNCIVLCPLHHVPFAHDHEDEFLKWLEAERPMQFGWVEAHRHYRSSRKMSYEEMYWKLNDLSEGSDE